uniref:Uncharacterized protein n=1 Tax=Wuchereria bancrofti TaxID=6293 RepID=A0A1I8EHI7_WUCBA
MLNFNSNLSEVKSTIGTSSLSSELTILSFTDITVSSQESFDNDNITLSAKNYPTITKLSSTMINISPQNIINAVLSHMPLSIALDKVQIYQPKISMNEQIRSESKTDDCISREIQSENIVKRKNSRKIMQKYYKTKSKKIFAFNAFPEENFRNNSENASKDNFNDTIIQWLECTQSQTERICNFDKVIELIESIEQEISAVESICLHKQLNIEELASGESLQIVNKKNGVIEANEMKGGYKYSMI